MTYESTTGEQVESEVLDLAAGGLFVRTDAPLAVGKRIAVDLTVVGEPGPWAALGRVVWVRAEAAEGRPAGMGVKLIDVDDATLAAIERLLDTREPTAPGVGGLPAVAPAGALAPPAPQREPTLVGVGGAVEVGEGGAAAAVSEPDVGPPAAPQADASETVAETAPAPSPPPPAPPAEPDAVTVPLKPREPSVALQVAPAPKPAAPKPAADEDSGGAGRWVVILLLLIVAGVAGYVLFDGFLRPLGH